jgi:cytochrome c biogenesis protein CcmG/thiol:disulfide interchange protein DsbE
MTTDASMSVTQRLQPVSIAMAILMACLGSWRSSGRAETLPLPTVALHQEDGSTVHLRDFAGKVVLVDFWASWCVPCKTSVPALDALYQHNRSRGLEVLAVNVDEQRPAADTFLSARPHQMPVIFDPTGEAAAAFKIRAMPSSVLIDRASRVRFTHVGYSTRVLESYQREIEQLLSEDTR